MHTLNESSSPAQLGFDLFGLLSLRLWPRGFTLAVLPRWLLALEVSFSSQGQAVSGKVLGRGLYGEVEGPREKGLPFFEYRVEEQARCLWLGRLRLELDRKSRGRVRVARTAEWQEG